MIPTMLTLIEAGVAQLPTDDGVNLYVAVPRVEVLMVAGLQVPAMPSLDVSGSTGGVEF